MGLSGVKWVAHFFFKCEENVGNSVKEATAYLDLDEAKILLKAIQGLDKVDDPLPLIDVARRNAGPINASIEDLNTGFLLKHHRNLLQNSPSFWANPHQI